jgi:hypothetical protein
MREVIKMDSDYHNHFDDGISSTHLNINHRFTDEEGGLLPFFSVRKLRLIYNELNGTKDFEFSNYDAFKSQVMDSVAPQVELTKWQAIASRR